MVGKAKARKLRLTASAPVSPATSAPAVPSDGHVRGRGPASSAGASARGFSSAVIELSSSDSDSHRGSATEDTAHSGGATASVSSPSMSEDAGRPCCSDLSRSLRDPWVLSRHAVAMPWEQLPRPQQEGAAASLSGASVSPWSGAGDPAAPNSDVEGSPSPLPLRQRLASQLRQRLPQVQKFSTALGAAGMNSGPQSSPCFGQPVTPLEGCGRQELASSSRGLPAGSSRCGEVVTATCSPEIISLITP